jgi:hypothetical protein
MDLRSIIRELYKEKQRLDRIIAELEPFEVDRALDPNKPAPKGRGRKSMSAEERRQVSDRMKRYWAKRRGR